jgi:hypothetical protein
MNCDPFRRLPDPEQGMRKAAPSAQQAFAMPVAHVNRDSDGWARPCTPDVARVAEPRPGASYPAGSACRKARPGTIAVSRGHEIRSCRSRSCVAAVIAETAVAVPAVPATTTEAMGRSRGRGEGCGAEGNRRDEREADLSQHDMYSSLDADARFAHPAPFVESRSRVVHGSALL